MQLEQRQALAASFDGKYEFSFSLFMVKNLFANRFHLISWNIGDIMEINVSPSKLGVSVIMVV